MHSIYDLTTYCRRTAGDVPAKLVGASTTVVGSKMYLFGGRLVTERKMVSDLYVFDLETFVWEKVPTHPEDDVPRARYFHSADSWDNKLIIFGGMSNQPDSLNPEELCVLNDVRFFDIATQHWLPTAPSSAASEALAPRARYAHLSSITADRLFIIGGQDFNNTWLDDVCVYDLVGKAWVQRREYPRHCGTYRSVAVSAQTAVRLPQEELRNSQSPSTLGPPGQRFSADKSAKGPAEPTSTESLIHLPYSAPPSEDYPSDIYLYSNYNFTDVKRELEVFTPLADTDFAIQDKSSSMAGSTLPPGLRFPTGAILGTHLIIAGTYLAHSYQSFSIWDLDLLTMTWSRIDPGKAVETGSWFRGCLWAESNKFLIFGNKNGNLVDDYNRRLLSWDHVAVVDLEAFGIYQPPPLKLDVTMQELGLAALEEKVVTDFEIICDDGRKIACSRKILEERWPWFAEQRRKFSAQAKQTASTLPVTPMDVGLPEISGSISGDDRIDPRLTPRSFHLSEPYPITLALLQYFYSYGLVTPLQHAPAVLSQLLILASNYQIDHLSALVKHAMHRALSSSTSVGVYEVATLCNCRSLQIRALKTVMVHTQKRPSRSKGDSDSRPSGGSGGPGGGSGPGRGGGGDGSGSDMGRGSRPRGTSDARWRTGDSNSSGYNSRPGTGNVPMNIMSNEEDKVTPLPNLNRSKSHRRPRPQSIVSIRTEEEMHDLANFLSPVAGLNGSPALEAGFQEDIPEETPAQFLASPSLSHQRSHPDISRQTSHSSLAATSDSDHHYSSDADQYAPHTSSRNPYRRARPPRISTDSVPSLPSLTSSASFNSLHNYGVLPSPLPDTPLGSSLDLPSTGPDYLDIIAELDRGADESDDRTTRPSDEFNPFKAYHNDDLLSSPRKWPQQKSDIHWLTSDPLRSPTSPKILASPTQEIITYTPRSHLPTPPAEPSRPPSPTPTTATTATTAPNSAKGFSRLLGKKKPAEDSATIEEKRRKKEEAKAKRAEAKALREKQRLEKIEKDISMYPMRMGDTIISFSNI